MNSTPGKVACIRHIERVQIDAIKFERTQIPFFSDVFTAVVALLLKIPFKIQRRGRPPERIRKEEKKKWRGDLTETIGAYERLGLLEL